VQKLRLAILEREPPTLSRFVPNAIDRTGSSPEPTAPPFKDVANTPGMTETALTVWLRTSHPTMPNIIVEPADMDNVIAYILSLKD
jgi:hypothetical protein